MGGDNVQAQYMMGSFYEDGDDVSMDVLEAIRYFWEAAKGGSAEAASRLEIMYPYGEYSKKDSKQAFHFFRIASESPQAKPSLEGAIAMDMECEKITLRRLNCAQ